MQRRDFLMSSALLSIAPTGFAQTTQSVAYIAAAKTALGEHSFVCLDEKGDSLAEHNVASRGHSFAYSKVQEGGDCHIAAIARRPADFCLILDQKGQLVTEFTSQPSRHFYGHGVYSLDGKYLYLTENDYGVNGSRGMIGVYDAVNNYERITEFESSGIGPHEIALSADGQSLIVANGGIQTHPERGRKKLNLNSMKPNLAFLDRETGKLINKAELAPEFSTNSIRHITVSDSGDVYVALQQQVRSNENCLLAHYDSRTRELNPIVLSDQHEAMLNNYVGDINLDHSQQLLALTSPRGNVLLLADMATGDVQSFEINDVCGLSKTVVDGQFVASSGDGKLMLVEIGAPAVNIGLITDKQNLYWDNHLIVL